MTSVFCWCSSTSSQLMAIFVVVFGHSIFFHFRSGLLVVNLLMIHCLHAMLAVAPDMWLSAE